MPSRVELNASAAIAEASSMSLRGVDIVASRDRTTQTPRDHPHRLHRHRFRDRLRRAVDEGLQGVGQRIHAGCGGYRCRQAESQLRVEQGNTRAVMDAAYRQLHLLGLVGEHRPNREFAPGGLRWSAPAMTGAPGNGHFAQADIVADLAGQLQHQSDCPWLCPAPNRRLCRRRRRCPFDFPSSVPRSVARISGSLSISV